ncbi:MAG: hypothetical protein V7K20_11125 [Nostoc sp.]
MFSPQISHFTIGVITNTTERWRNRPPEVIALLLTNLGLNALEC